MTKCAIYSRVSTDEHTTENQLMVLREIAERKGMTVVAEFNDEGISGAKGRDKRTGFDNIIKGAVKKDYDTILVWSVDRLGRSLQDLVSFLNEIHSVGCDLYIHQSGLDTSTPTGKMMFQMVGVFSEFERSMISERVKLGLKRVKSKGTKLGRPTKIDDVTREQVWNMVDEGKSLSQISKILEISKMSVSRVNRERNP